MCTFEVHNLSDNGAIAPISALTPLPIFAEHQAKPGDDFAIKFAAESAPDQRKAWVGRQGSAHSSAKGRCQFARAVAPLKLNCECRGHAPKTPRKTARRLDRVPTALSPTGLLEWRSASNYDPDGLVLQGSWPFFQAHLTSSAAPSRRKVLSGSTGFVVSEA